MPDAAEGRPSDRPSTTACSGRPAYAGNGLPEAWADSHEACAASKLRAAMLVEAGFTNVYSFAGGLAEWAGAGLPLIESTRQAA